MRCAQKIRREIEADFAELDAVELQLEKKIVTFKTAEMQVWWGLPLSLAQMSKLGQFCRTHHICAHDVRMLINRKIARFQSAAVPIRIERLKDVWVDVALQSVLLILVATLGIAKIIIQTNEHDLPEGAALCLFAIALLLLLLRGPILILLTAKRIGGRLQDLGAPPKPRIETSQPRAMPGN